MKIRNVLMSLLAVALIWACGKDDDPAPPKNNAPVIAAKTFTVAENIAPGTTIGSVTATDADKDALTFSIATNDGDLFAITKAGALSLASGKTLSFATKAQHVITVAVSDGEASASAKVTINVTQVDPENQAPIVEPQEFTVVESIADTEAIGTIMAIDPEEGTLGFAIAVNDNDLFEIDPATGELSLAEGKQLDFGTAQEHVVTVAVSDGNSATTAAVTVNVTQDPLPTGDPQSFEAEENIADTEVIGTVVAEDPEGQALTFSIKTNDNDLFEITEGGELSLAAGKALDFETQNKHDIVVSVGDGYNSIDINVSIKVLDDGVLADDPTAFVTTWKTDADGEDVGFFLKGSNLTIDWGDGQVETNLDIDGFKGHTYTSAGTYTVAIKGDLIGFSFLAVIDTPEKLVGMEQWGTAQWEDMSLMFYTALNMVYNAKDVPDLSKVTSMSNMFQYATSFNGAIGNWDTSNVTNMVSMFDGATSFDGAIGNWDVSNVTNMTGMFQGAIAFDQDLSGWDTSNVTNMASMFEGATAFNGDIGNWDVSNVTNMWNMFRGAIAFNQDLNGWGNKLGNVTNMKGMFSGATAFKGDISNWDVSNVTNMFAMFEGATAFNGAIGNWDVSNVTDMFSMFWGATAFNQDLSGWNVVGVTNMNYMFNGASAFDQSLASWNIGNVTNMTEMLDNSGMSAKNYSYTLIGWAAQNVQNGVTLGSAGLNYCTNGSEAETARTSLIQDHGWTISPNGQVLCFGF